MSVQVISQNSPAAVLFQLSEQDWRKFPALTIRIVWQTEVHLRRQTFVQADSSACGLFQLETALLEPDSPMLNIAAGRIEPTRTKSFLILIYNYSTTPRCLPKHTVLADGVAPPPFIAGIDDDTNDPATLLN